ncbi:hypothetical protein V8C40DRAFT_253936 [Trichoderma camerunense]
MRPPWPPVVFHGLPWSAVVLRPKDWKLHHRPFWDAAACRRRLAWHGRSESKSKMVTHQDFVSLRGGWENEVQ